MRRINANRLIRYCMLAVSVLVCSGYPSIIGICLDDDGSSHFEEMGLGCCHCPGPNSVSSETNHCESQQEEHCTDLEVPFNFVGSGLSRGIFEVDSVENDFRPPEVYSSIGTVHFDPQIPRCEKPPPLFRDQISTLISSTIVLC